MGKENAVLERRKRQERGAGYGSSPVLRSSGILAAELFGSASDPIRGKKSPFPLSVNGSRFRRQTTDVGN